MMRHLPARHGCISVDGSNLLAQVSWRYYGGQILHRNDERRCALRLILRPKNAATSTDPDWVDVWQGSRPREDDEIYVLQRRHRR